jgi:GNAT superfamily N-acetyltransferase
MTLIVRLLETRDQAAWRRLWNEYCDFYDTKIPDDITALTWARLHDASVFLHGWCAELDGAVIGLTHALEHLSTWSQTPYVYIEDLFVDRKVRKSGAGSALIEAVYAHADKINAPKVYWQTEYTNETARKLYEQIGVDSGYMVYRRP